MTTEAHTTRAAITATEINKPEGGRMMHVAKENLAGRGYNTHAVGRNPGLWTAEYAIVKNAVMQAELDDMRAQLAKQARTTAPA